MGLLKNKTILITGGSRGIGREIALRVAASGANVVLIAKTKTPHEFLPHTIMSVAEEVEKHGGKALPYQMDVRDDEAIAPMIEKTVATFHTIDALINNAGAIYLTDSLSTDAKKFDLMQSINCRATFLLSRACLPHISKNGGHIINMSPPINLDKKWLAPHVAYTISKFSMSMCTLAMAEEFRQQGVAVNSLWPKTIIYTSAVTRLMGKDAINHCRKPSIMADAAAWILQQDPRELTGNLFLDEDVLKQASITDLSFYRAIEGSADLMPDLYVDQI